MSTIMSAAANPAVVNAGEPLPQRMRRFREECGLSRAELADRTGLSRPTIWAWESGKSRPRQSNLETLAHALGISAQELTGKDQSEAMYREMDAMGLSAWRTVGIPAGAGNAHRLSVLIYGAQLVIAAMAGVDARNVRISIKR
ncbi:helix-turn-helix domain-containing protein [Sphingopyxis fribergensis]|nr:helix-turn-helix transcriptional regulator [Sphingopyxis fribergensis]